VAAIDQRRQEWRVFETIEPKVLYFGTPVVLISTLNEDGTPNLAPMSSAWTLGWTVLLGLGAEGKTLENLAREGECVLNFPPEALAAAVERLAPLTGKSPMPEEKRALYRYEPDKFGAAGLTPMPSAVVRPPRVMDCPLQMEGRVRGIGAIGRREDGVVAVEVEVVRVHALRDIIRGERHIDPNRWRPLIYSFRHYFGLGPELGKSFKSET
jgi:flavin reductase (DIM6/NTAB) family NADH-FMN oxidoreductase RutF